MINKYGFFWFESKQSENSIFVQIALDRFAQSQKNRIVQAFRSQIAAVKKSSDEKLIVSFEVFYSKSNALIAMKVPEVWICWFEIEKTMANMNLTIHLIENCIKNWLKFKWWWKADHWLCGAMIFFWKHNDFSAWTMWRTKTHAWETNWKTIKFRNIPEKSC